MKAIAVSVAFAAALPAAASAHDPIEGGDPGSGTGADAFHHMRLLSQSPSGAPGARPTNSDIAFWGDRAYVGNYNGFRIFDISKTKPRLITDFSCVGAQNDPSVYDRDGDGRADLLILSVDRTMTGPSCSATPATDHADPAGWEGLRIFDISDERSPQLITGVYQDCGSHTNTIVPRPQDGRLLVLNSSYPLRPGPTCGPVRGPAAGRSAVHGVVQVVQVPLSNPAASSEMTELPINYPGDADNKFTPSEHGLSSPALVDGMRACHDIAVFPALDMAAGACAEQAQVWRLNPATGLPDTANPVWTYDQDNVDFWHSATFSWDGKVTNFIDESFGDGCPTFTTKTAGKPGPPQTYETGNMFFLDTASGARLSEFRIDRSHGDESPQYCSSHLGNVVPSTNRYLLVNAYYRGGSSVIDFTNPRQPKEVAFYDRAQADTWSAYWYETGNAPQGSSIPVFANDGVHTPNTGGGFQAFKAWVGPTKRVALPHLNPQVQERVVTLTGKPAGGLRKGSGTTSRNARVSGRDADGKRTTGARARAHHGG